MLSSRLVDRACDTAEEEGIDVVGLTGGVSYSSPIAAWTKEAVERRGLRFADHHRVPNGDGGVSTGQNAVAGAMLG